MPLTKKFPALAALVLGCALQTVPAGDLQSGVVWDYLRLELDDGASR